MPPETKLKVVAVKSAKPPLFPEFFIVPARFTFCNQISSVCNPAEAQYPPTNKQDVTQPEAEIVLRIASPGCGPKS